MRVLAMRGAKVIGTARTEAKAKQALQELGIQDGVALECELSEPKSIKACIQEIQKRNLKLDVLLCNAGIMALPKLQLHFGLEMQFFTNHIGHFLLIKGLLDDLGEDARVILVSSSAHQAAPKQGIDFENLDGSKGYSPWRFYGQYKFANLLLAKELARKFQGT